MLRKPSLQEINSMNKDTLKKTLKEIIKNLNEEKEFPNLNPLSDTEAADISRLLNTILTEVTDLRKEKLVLKKEIDAVKKENLELKANQIKLEGEQKYLTDAILQHQRFLEAIDGQKRAENLIITGVPEESVLKASGAEAAETAETDSEKVSLVLKQIGHKDDTIVINVVRLGKKYTGPNARPRPLKVITGNPQERKRVIDDAKKLKNVDERFKKIFIKKDIHPAVRKEQNRIRFVEKEERQKPENQGKDVKYDFESRCLLVDGIIVDRFKPSFF